MQKIKVKSISIKRGQNDKGPWVNTQINADDGSKWAGFLEGLSFIKEGDVIDVTEYEEGIGNKRNKILKYDKVESAPSSSRTSDNEMTKDDWAEKSRIERESIQRQKVLAHLDTLMEMKEKYPDDLLVNAVYNWSFSQFTQWSSQGEPPKVKGKVDKEEIQKAIDREEQDIPKEIVSNLNAINWHRNNFQTARSWISTQFKVTDTGDLAEMLKSLAPEKLSEFTGHIKIMREASGK